MKRFIIFLVLFMFGCISYLFVQQKEIVEEVSIEYWVVPVFAVDKDGKAVIDLTSPEIELTVDNKKIETFTMIRRSFTSEEAIPQSSTPTPKETGPALPLPTLSEKTKNVFLLFDNSLSTADSTEKAKAIARKMVEKAEKNTIFYVLGIEPFTGLVYFGGQTTDKTKIATIIDKVKAIPNKRNPEDDEMIKQAETLGKQSRFDDADIETIKKQRGEFYKFKIDKFQKAFETLYYAINTIKDNKFIYLFTEGISRSMQNNIFGGTSVARKFISNISSYLGRSGAVLFIINPKQKDQMGKDESGDESLKLLVEKSGGKLFDGNENSILDRMEKMNNAYYEIFFPASLKSGSHTLSISIKSKRKDVDIHTMQTTEKPREYSRMEDIEREVLALNIISGNPLFKTGLSFLDAEYIDISPKKGSPATTVYEVTLPTSFVNRKLDIYKVWLNKKKPEPRIEKENVINTPSKLQVTFKNGIEGDETYFVIIDGEQKISLAKGIKNLETPAAYRITLSEDNEEWFTPKLMEKEKESGKSEDKDELNRLLKGAAVYCEKLKVAAFHCLCKEKIVETQRPLYKHAGVEDDIVNNPEHEIFATVQPADPHQKPIVIKTNKYEFYYRLIKRGVIAKELREKIGKGDNENSKTEQQGEIITDEILKTIRFLSSKSVFAPITLLDGERQKLYHFRLVGHEKIQDRPTTIIEAVPKNEKDAQVIYGKLWIDDENFSVLKIKANPNSILGYNRLRNLANELGAMLHLTLETEFFKINDNIRFPTRIHFVETYSGGTLISSQTGSKGWQRTESYTTYSDYLFFNVQTDVTYEK